MEINIKKLEVKFLKGIGPKRAQLLEKHGIVTVDDLLSYYPSRYLDRSNVVPMREVNVDDEITVIGDIVSSRMAMGRGKRLQVTVTDLTGMMTLVFFNQPAYFKKLFAVGKKVALSGKVTYFKGYQLVHPDFEFLGEDKETGIHTGAIIPLYRIPEAFRKAGISSHALRRIIHKGLEKYKNHIEELLPLNVINEEHLFLRRDAVYNMHFPQSADMFYKALRYIKFEELFYLLTLIGIQKKQYNSSKTGIAFHRIGETVKTLILKLPFELTGAQKRVLQEIYTDMQKDTPMHRLVQGDVGCGKTIVALISMLIARENGFQTALMAPTEILAEQHYYNFKNLLQPFGIEPLLLKGGQKGKVRQSVLTGLENDYQAIVIGTHALIQQGVNFKNLGFVVIDEQHRFGVLQRASLIDKGKVPDILVMTATPIPRTLSFTVFGDLDHSRIDEMPPGRLPIVTAWRKDERLPKIYDFIQEKIAAGEQVYIVLPLVEESEKLDVQAAEQMYEKLKTGRF
ncbi:MAG: ATP-dependent DNA helicase RecG, partial [Calditrichia bacterium]|nr:ATP-dependent DNA helicase RecG [Calditrichia bacterium]